MLPLDSPRWAELEDAYGSAENIPALLQQLKTRSGSTDEGEPWHTLWSALAHQGDVYSASFAAVPHIVEVLATDPVQADHSFFQFPAWIEICRQKKAVAVPSDLETAYFDALRRLPTLAAAALAAERDEDFLRCAMSAIAAAKDQTALAEVVLELSPVVVTDFWNWFYER